MRYTSQRGLGLYTKASHHTGSNPAGSANARATMNEDVASVPKMLRDLVYDFLGDSIVEGNAAVLYRELHKFHSAANTTRRFMEKIEFINFVVA